MSESRRYNAHIIDQVEALVQEVGRRLDAIVGGDVDGGLLHRQYVVLSVVDAHESISIGNLGRLLGSAQSTISEMVARLDKAGLLTKGRGSPDGRLVTAKLTGRGRQRLRVHRGKARVALRSIVDKLDSVQRKRLELSLRYLVRVLRAAELR
jgi:DNA-binding MarR family transcriptional regulator